MKQVMTVFSYTLKEAIRKKAFIISTIVILFLVLIVAMIPRGIELFSGDDQKKSSVSTEEKANENDEANGEENQPIYYYIDEQQEISGGQQALQAAFPEAKLVQGSREKIKEYYKEINEKNEDSSIIIVDSGEPLPQVMVVNKSFLMGPDSDMVSGVLKQSYNQDLLTKKGLEENTIAKATNPLPITKEYCSKMNGSAYVLSMLLSFLMFFSVYYYGYTIAMSIATEKSSRVMETLVTSAKPSRILIGKILAMGTLGLIQLMIIFGFAIVAYKTLVPEDLKIKGMSLSLKGIEPSLLFLTIIYFILGYVLYAVMNSVCGALVSKIEDLNSAIMPVNLVGVGSFYLAYAAAAMGNQGVVQKIATYLPLSSPFAVPTQLAQGQLDAVSVIISISILLASIVLIAMVSIKIYTASVLHYGKREKLSKLYRTKV